MEPLRRRFEFGVLGVLTNSALLLVSEREGREPVEVDLLGQKPLLPPNTAVNRPQLDLLSGEVSPIYINHKKKMKKIKQKQHKMPDWAQNVCKIEECEAENVFEKLGGLQEW